MLAVVSADRAFAEATRARRPLRPGRRQARRRPAQGQGRRARRDVRPALGGGGRGPQGPRARLPRRDGAARPGLRRRCGASTGPHVGRPAHPLRGVPRTAASRGTASRRGRVSATGADGARGRYARNAIIQGVGGRALQGVGGDGAPRGAAARAARSCCACTTSCSSTCPSSDAAGRGGGRRASTLTSAARTLGRHRRGPLRRRHVDRPPVERGQGLTRAEPPHRRVPTSPCDIRRRELSTRPGGRRA